MRVTFVTLVTGVGVLGFPGFPAAQDCDPAAPFAFSLLASDAVESPVDTTIDVFLSPGTQPSLDVTAYLDNLTGAEVTVLGCAGLFTMAVAHDGDVLQLENVTVEGTEYGALPVAPYVAWTVPSSEPGFVVEDLLCLETHAIPVPQSLSVVKATYSLVEPVGLEKAGETIVTSLRFQDGLRIRGQPVTNQVFHEDARVSPCVRALEIRFHVREDRDFVRGDANFDTEVNVSDPVSVLQGLFDAANSAIHCNDAADSNDDGFIDVSDAIFVFDYLFSGGIPPPRPFPSSGADPTLDALTCVDLP